MLNPMNQINQSKLNQSMSYIFSSNPNNYTFKKLDNMLINMPKNDGKHVFIRETVDGIPQYSWTTPSECFVKVNNATLFEHTHISTQPFNNQCQFELSWVYIWRSHRFHVTMRMIPYSNIVILSNWLWIRDTR